MWPPPDIVGPDVPLYLAGARLLEVFPMVQLLGTVTLAIGGMSYAGQFNAMVVADAKSYSGGVMHPRRGFAISPDESHISQLTRRTFDMARHESTADRFRI